MKKSWDILKLEGKELEENVEKRTREKVMIHQEKNLAFNRFRLVKKMREYETLRGFGSVRMSGCSPDFKIADENQIRLKVPTKYIYCLVITDGIEKLGWVCPLQQRMKQVLGDLGVGYRWMFDIDYLTNSINYIPVSLENQAKPHAGTSTVTNHTGTSEVTNSAGASNTNASEEEDEYEELIIVPIAVQHTTEKVGTRKPSTNSKKEEYLIELQNLKSQEKEASPKGITEDAPDILAF
ncbi:hypothetical protein Tco_0488391 [Tanacetum coccineum]